MKRTLLALIGLCCVTTGCASSASHSGKASLPHFFQVDEDLYRGGQPTLEGFQRLKDLGVKTVVSLRSQGDEERERERELVESLGMQWMSLPMRMYWRPTPAQVHDFLDVAMDPANQPVFVHCQKGEDRTGSMVALYRIIKQGWPTQYAYNEALKLGMADWNPFTRYLILTEIRNTYRPRSLVKRPTS